MAKARTTPIYTSPQDAALAFYRAFETQDIDVMMATWADDEDIVCVHPGGARLVGYEAVRSGWEQLFSGDAKLSFRLEQIVVLETVGLAMQIGDRARLFGGRHGARRSGRHQRVHAYSVGLAHGVPPCLAGVDGDHARAERAAALTWRAAQARCATYGAALPRAVLTPYRRR